MEGIPVCKTVEVGFIKGYIDLTGRSVPCEHPGNGCSDLFQQKPSHMKPTFTNNETSVLHGILWYMDIDYDYRTGEAHLCRDSFAEDYRVGKVNALIQGGTITVDDLREYVHSRLLHLGTFEADKRIKGIAIPTPRTDVLVCYAVICGAAPWSMHTSDTVVGLALKLLSQLVRELTTPFVPKELPRDFCC
jgi:hypothetical protein